MTISEGKNREVRRVFAQVGAKVQSLKRIRIGRLADRRLKPGQWRPLLRSEVAALLAETGAEDGVEREAAEAGPRVYTSRSAPRAEPRGKPKPQGKRFGPRAAQRWGERNAGVARPRAKTPSRGKKKR